MSEVRGERRTIWIPEELWARGQRAALKISYEGGEKVTISELIRRGLEQQIKAAGLEEADA
jgi:hypothetical protein